MARNSSRRWTDYTIVMTCLVTAACYDDSLRPTLPPSLAAGPGVPESLPEIFGDPVDFRETWDIYWPPDPPAWFTDDSALVESVRRSKGQVHIGFKEPGVPKLAARAGPGGDRVPLPPVSAAAIRAGRAFVEAHGATIRMPFRYLRGVVASIDPERVLEILASPLTDYIEPVIVYQPGASLAAATSLQSGQTIPANMERIRAPDAWPVVRGEGVWIYILDTGIEGGMNHHSDLKQLDPYGCAVMHPLETSCADDPNFILFGHGLAVAGVALATDNTSHVVGVAPNPHRWVSVRVCSGQHPMVAPHPA